MKQVILMRTDIGMSVGKMCAQAAHAAIKPDEPTIVVQVLSEDQLVELMKKASRSGVFSKSVFDAGHTEVPAGTRTCGCILGEDEKIDKITGQLKLL